MAQTQETRTPAEEAALRAFARRNGDDDDDDDKDVGTPARRTSKKTPMPTEKVLSLPRQISIGGVEMLLKAYEVERVRSVQAALWQMPTVILGAALSTGSGIDADGAFETFCRIDSEAEAFIQINDTLGALQYWRAQWRRMSVSQDLLVATATEALVQLAVNEDDLPLSQAEIETALSSSSLLVTDLIELIQTIFDVCGGFPGDIRSRF